MAGKALNIKVCSPLKLRSGLTGNYHAICHYSYNLPLAVSVGQPRNKRQDNIKDIKDIKENGKKH